MEFDLEKMSMTLLTQTSEIPGSRETFCSKLECYVAEQYTQSELKIQDIATGLAMCERQLQRNTRQNLNMSPIEYLRTYRLLRSTELLLPGTPINSVVFKVGFASYSYFARCFKREFGCTAKQYVTSTR